MTTDTPQNTRRVTIILHSGAYDRVCYALCIALAALSSGKEVHIMLTFEGLKRFSKGHLMDLGEETPGTVRSSIKSGLESGAMEQLDEQLALARQMGLKVYACPNAMATLQIPRRELVEVDEVMGLVAFMELASTTNLNWYI